jgi:hypothetical protein
VSLAIENSRFYRPVLLNDHFYHCFPAASFLPLAPCLNVRNEFYDRCFKT